MSALPEGLEWARIFWVNGRSKMIEPRAVQDPPCNGWQSAMIIWGEKRSVIFCPYTYESWQVPNDCKELETRETSEFNPKWFGEFMLSQWTQFQTRGVQKDYDTATLIWTKLGQKAPEPLMKGGEKDERVKGGKDAADELKKAVKREGKRGRFVKWFMDGEATRSVRETMAELGMTRSNVLSYLHALWKDHGIGYTLVGDNVTIKVPGGDPFEEDDAWLEA